VSRGKGEAALKEFAYRLRRQKAIKGIKCVCMDMSNAYFAWVAKNLGEDVLIVFDHFHVVMKMNEHINNIRRLAMAQVNSDTRRRLAELAESDEDKEAVRRLMLNAQKRQDKAKEYLKGNMRLLLMNAEDVAELPKAKARLDRMLAKYTDINSAYILKEKLRSIYANAKTKAEAAGLFKDWIEEARATEVDDLAAMASTIEDHLAGILGFWEFRGASNASVEGFNNKIRWLIKQAYGYRDFKYFRLKVFDLPNLKARDGDC
jgi:transposase